MRPLTTPELLQLWEEGRGRDPTERALMLLARACPEETRESLLALPVGRRDARLLELREWAFGPEITSLACCPACGERLELGFAVADLQAGAGPPPDDALAVTTAGYEVSFRLPNSADLALLRGAGDAGEARERLLRRCLLGARRDGRVQRVDRLPARVIEAVVRRMGEVDPQADVRTALTCPGCFHAWEAAFDIVSFFWTEIEDWARATLRTVHALASAYGWREAEILALSPARRQLYLEMVHP